MHTSYTPHAHLMYIPYIQHKLCYVALQAFNSSSELVMQGSASILSGLQVYQTKEWVLHSWRDVFVDLVQGQLQFLFLSLLAGELCCSLSCCNYRA